MFPLQIPHQYKNLRQNQAKDEYEKHHAKLIHELIECDEFDDIATLKVRDGLPKFAIHSSLSFQSMIFFSCPEYWWVAQSKFIGFGGQTLQDWRLNRTQAGGMGNPITLLPPTAQRSTYPTPHPQVARAPGADHLGLSSHSWIPPHGHYAYGRRKGWATPGGNFLYIFDIWVEIV